ncbi:uroporphyrinogen decarboxylase family protein [Syntrophomonas palmitatica]|uniref:uroporphyrinogen decarboxylase family protein n=1 Tax=Syntrophomonas palmitatica TaxID=402877 RepID=UPI0006CF75BF|nr:uroporphyrinogen decarboxylase family protein [Syntrophomonas palmitatica]
MTPKERMTAFLSGQEIDRLPCCPSLGETCAPLFGMKTSTYYRSAECMAEIEIEVFNRFRPDGAGIGMGLRAMPEAMGAKVGYPDYGIAYIQEPLLKDYDDIKHLRRIDPWRDPCLSMILRANQMVQDAIGNQVAVSSGIVGPFTLAAAIRGFENLLRDIYKNPQAVHDILAVVTENNLRYIDSACSLGLGTGIGDPVASGSMISPEHFREFAKPYLKICIDRIRKWTGSGGRLHICGKTKNLWNDMVDCGASILSIDNIEDLEEAKQAVGDRVCLMGNVDPVKTIKEGTVADVHREVRECIRKAQNNPRGFIISSGCQIPIGTPGANIQAMMDAA